MTCDRGKHVSSMKGPGYPGAPVLRTGQLNRFGEPTQSMDCRRQEPIIRTDEKVSSSAFRGDRPATGSNPRIDDRQVDRTWRKRFDRSPEQKCPGPNILRRN